MIKDIIIPVAAMAGLGLVFGLGIAYALKIFGIEVDPTVALIITRLPGSNCGACGRAGCAGFASALKKGDALPTGCVLSNEQARRAISDILGIEYNPKIKTIATLLCNGGKRAKDKYHYRGIKTCKASTLVFSGYKACTFGCLEFGDCVEACPFDAIKIGEDALPVVDPTRCVACGKCVKACPKGLFELVPVDKLYYVKCNSKEPGAVVTKVCSAGCIACRKCEKACPIGAIKVDTNLAKIDYAKCQDMGKCFEACPTKVIIKRM